jgi:hypothetical protein
MTSNKHENLLHLVGWFTGNLTCALKSSVNDDVLSFTEVPSITRMVSIDPFLSRAHDKSIWLTVLFGIWRIWLRKQLLQTRTQPPDHFRRENTIFIYMETLFSDKFVFRCFRKETISFLVSVLPSVRMEQLGSLRMEFHEILYYRTSRKFVDRIQVSLKPDKNSKYFTLTLILLMWRIGWAPNSIPI